MENWKSNSNKIPDRKSSTIVVAVAVLLKSGSSVTLRFYTIFVCISMKLVKKMFKNEQKAQLYINGSN